LALIHVILLPRGNVSTSALILAGVLLGALIGLGTYTFIYATWAAYQDTATEEQVLEAVKYLVEELEADVNFVADTGETALHAAAYRGANSVVQYLVDKGATLDVVDKIGRTPLKVAEGVEYGNSFQAQPHTAELLRKRRETDSVPRFVCEPHSGGSAAT
jgi:ankyrin repeat protein